MIGISIRLGSPADHAFVRDLGAGTMIDSIASFRKFLPEMVEASYESLLEFTFAQSHVLFIAESGGKPVGFMLAIDSLPDEVTRMPQLFVVYMAVEPSQRRRGIGRQLLASVEDWARHQNLPYIGLMVTEENDAARHLYETAGFLNERRLLCKPL